MHGQGVYTWLDGRNYIGDFVNDKKEGHGIFKWADGRVFNGVWKNGK